jgi:hypothetical protein
MERELFRSLYCRAHDMGRARHSPSVIHPDWKIVVVYLWAVMHNRPVAWACQPQHWPEAARHLRLPSPSTMSRRLRRDEVKTFIDALEAALCDRARSADGPLLIDAKPLPVGSCSKDPDSAAGFAGCGVAKGYKLHTICNTRRIPVTWCVRPMNENEAKVAPKLIRQLPRGRRGLLAGDNAYDKNLLYDEAGQHGWQLYAPRRQSVALGHRTHSPWRIIAHCELSEDTKDGLTRARLTVERFFAHLTQGYLGLSPLPSWVRGLERVRRWVQAKIIIYLARRALRAARNAA